MEISVELGGGIRGVLHEPAGRQNTPAVVALHGFTGSKIEEGRIFVRLGRALETLGIACLRFDFRGSGDSDGEFAEMTFGSETSDARAAIAWLRSRSEIQESPIGLLGLSLGSVVAQEVAPTCKVQALCLWATITRPDLIFAEDRGWQSRGYAAGPRFFSEMKMVRPLDALRRYSGPLLCVHGTEDWVSPEHSKTAIESVSGPAELHLIEGGGHTFGTKERQDEALEVTGRFFLRTLTKTGA